MPRPDIADRLQDFLSRSGLHYKTQSKSYVFDCPKCHKHDKLWMFRDSGGFKCWFCGDDFSGAPEFALAKMTGRSIAEIRAEIRGTTQITGSKYLDISFDDLFGTDDVDEDEEVEVPPDPQPQEWPYHCWPADHHHARDGVAYMASRGISQEMMLRYDVRYSTVKRAVAFPCWVRGKLLGWQYRTIDKVVEILPEGQIAKRLRLISEAVPRDRTLMFSDRITSDFAVLCEGPVDALKVDLVGGNVASMGKAVAGGQIQALLQAGITRLYLAVDPDAVKEVDRLASEFEGVEVRRVVIPPQYKDLGEMPLEAARDAVLAAKVHHVGRVLPIWFDFGRRVG